MFVDNDDVDDGSFDTNQEVVYYDEGNDNQEEVLYGDQGEALIVKRACYSPRLVDNDRWLCTNIFHTSCTIGVKICKLIIDAGSCEMRMWSLKKLWKSSN